MAPTSFCLFLREEGGEPATSIPHLAQAVDKENGKIISTYCVRLRNTPRLDFSFPSNLHVLTSGSSRNMPMHKDHHQTSRKQEEQILYNK